MQLRTSLLSGLSMLALAGCGSLGSVGEEDRSLRSAPSPAVAAVPDTPARIGDPYTLGGQRYTPVDQADYDEVGYASWYGNELAGRPTANGESFNPAWVSAAHRTLPMPSYVEVTRLDTGQTILVRINDRGPADSRRLIDLSAGAAAQLGISEAGTIAVRVRRTNPVEAERVALRSGQAVPERLPTPDSLLAILRERAARLPVPTGPSSAPAVPAPSARSRPDTPPRAAPAAAQPVATTAAATPDAPVAAGYVVQLAAFGSRSRADALARRYSATVSPAGTVYRVRLGPYTTEAEARAALTQLRGRGFSGGAVLRNR